MVASHTFHQLARSALAAAALACAAALPALAQPAADTFQLLEQEKNTVNLYKVFYPSVEMGRKAAISFHEQMMESRWDAGHLVMELDAADMDKLRVLGFRFEPATEFIQRRNQVLTQLQGLQASQASAPRNGAAAKSVGVQSIPNYSCYETVEETFAAAEGFVASRPTLASLVDAGDSWLKTQGAGGYDMRVLRLTNSAVAGDKPKLFINSAIHAREYTTTPLVLEFARWLVNGHGVNADATWILDHHEVHLMLHTNPDGRKRAESGLSWRKNVNNNFCANTNNRGIDLNRNFSFSWNATAGQGSSGDACNLTFRGPSGGEPETQAVQAYVRSLWPDRRGPCPLTPRRPTPAASTSTSTATASLCCGPGAPPPRRRPTAPRCRRWAGVSPGSTATRRSSRSACTPPTAPATA